MKKTRIKVNGRLPGYQIGQVVEVPCDAEGTPLVEFWRRRLRDARLDDCCEVVRPRPAARPKSRSQQRRLAAQRGES